MEVVKIIEIDGSAGEGGGQILRTSISLSALINKPVKIYNIRAKRPNPGLQAQHVTAIKALAKITNAKVTGDEIGSRTVIFHPDKPQGGSFNFDVGTAGSISLVMQTIMPCSAFSQSPTRLEITGGTDVSWSPPIDYINNVTLPILMKMGYNSEITLVRRGHYPRGGGQVKAVLNPVKKLSPLNLVSRGEILSIKGISHAVRLPQHVAQRQADSAQNRLKKAGFKDVEIRLEWYEQRKDQHLGPGSGIVLWALTESGSVIGADALGERGKTAEKVGEEAADKLLKEIERDAPIDSHMGDMLIPYLAVADGRSEIKVTELTLHLLSNISVTEKILNVKFSVRGKEGQSGIISVDGLGLKGSV
ncbi:MAG: RNA 3'-terminal phosphate cyclase [Candidatus Jordarchaeaceae archaeon]